jgi:hypothetical protein
MKLIRLCKIIFLLITKLCYLKFISFINLWSSIINNIVNNFNIIDINRSQNFLSSAYLFLSPYQAEVKSSLKKRWMVGIYH